MCHCPDRAPAGLRLHCDIIIIIINIITITIVTIIITTIIIFVIILVWFTGPWPRLPGPIGLPLVLSSNGPIVGRLPAR